MKRILITLTIIVFTMVFASANLFAEKVVVPLSKPGQPCILKVNLLSGGITVSGTSGKDVIVDIEMATKKLKDIGEKGIQPPEPPGFDELEVREIREIRGETREKEIQKEKEDLKGLKRIPNVSMDVAIQEQDNVVAISSESMHHTVNLVIQVPFNTSLKLHCLRNGDIIADRVTGDHEAENLQGFIQLDHISGNVVAEAHRGHITATFSGVDDKKPMSFSTFFGKIDVTFPSNTRANLKMKSDRGDIYTDFDIKIQSKSRTSEKRSEGGKYSVTIEKGLYGTINGGGQEISFQTHQGNIIIRKGK